MSANLARGRYTSRRLIDYGGTSLTVLAVIIALIPLGAMLAWVLGQGARRWISTFSLRCQERRVKSAAAW
jgi:hypothetical protein